MTLVGLVPPLCDNGNMLVDGGYSAYSSFKCYVYARSYTFYVVDNLPVRLYMRRLSTVLIFV